MNRDQKPRMMDEPEPCFIRMKLVRDGRYVGARIFYRLGMLAAEINGVIADPLQVWHAGEFIDEARYNILMADPPINPYLPVHVTDRGLAERVREAEEADYWWTQPLK